MSYSYAIERERLFTEDGQVLFLKIRDNAQKLLKTAGAFKARNAWQDCSGDSWQFIAALDRLVELGEIIEVSQPGCWAQHRVFVDGSR